MWAEGLWNLWYKSVCTKSSMFEHIFMIFRDPLAKRFHIFPYNVESKHIPKDLLQKLQEGGDLADLGGSRSADLSFSLGRCLPSLAGTFLIAWGGSFGLRPGLESSEIFGIGRDMSKSSGFG